MQINNNKKTILNFTNNLIQEVVINTAIDNTHWFRSNISIGDYVCLVKKEDQRSGKLSCGVVQRLLTSKEKHTRGIKVMAIDDQGNKIYGRVVEIYKHKQQPKDDNKT